MPVTKENERVVIRGVGQGPGDADIGVDMSSEHATAVLKHLVLVSDAMGHSVDEGDSAKAERLIIEVKRKRK